MRCPSSLVLALILCLACAGPLSAEPRDRERLETVRRLVQRLEQAEPSADRLVTGMSWAPPGSEDPTRRIIPDHLVVKIKADYAQRAFELPMNALPSGLPVLDRFLEKHGIQDGHRLARTHGKPLTGKNLEAYRRHGMDRLYVLRLPEPGVATVLDLIEKLSRAPWVEYAAPATEGVPTLVPNDANYGLQWAHNNTGQSGGTPDADMDTQEAWDLALGSPSSIIAIADDGTLISHEDLSPNLVPGCGTAAGSCFDFVSGDFDPTPATAGDSHGTGTAGVAAARGFNTVGVSGTCFRCGLMPLLTCNSLGCSSTNFQDAIVHAANNGAGVINISYCFGYSQAWVDAVNTAKDMGTLTTASLGNATTIQACTPATTPNGLAIGGTGRNDQRIFAQGTHHWVSAPGTGIWSTTTGSNSSYTPSFGGTSASAPFVAGIIGLINTRDPNLHPNEVVSLLALGAEDQVGPPSDDPPGFDISFGHGRANARNSVELVDQEWIDIQRPHHVCGGTITIGYHNPTGCDGQTVTVGGDINGDSVDITVSDVTDGSYCEGTVDLNWAVLESVDLGDSLLTIEHDETLTVSKNAVSDTSFADCERSVCHWPAFTNWDFRDLIHGDCDGDGALDPGHVVRIAPAWVNIETEPVSDVGLVLSSDSPYLDFTTDATVFAGELAPFTGTRVADASVDPIFTMRVLPGAPPNSVATINVEIFSTAGYVADTQACANAGFDDPITIPLNRDTGALVQEFDFDDGTAQGWTSVFPHDTGSLSECENFSWVENDWGSLPTTDNPHQGAHAMRLGNGSSYQSGTDSGLQSPVISVPTDGVMGFYSWVETEPANPGFAWDGITLEGKTTAAGQWSPMALGKLGEFSSEPSVSSCGSNPFPFGVTENVPLIAGDGAAASPFGDAYDYEHYVELSAFSGQDAQLRFRAGSDSNTEGAGVWLDTIRIYGPWTADTWPGTAPADVAGSDANCATSFDVSSATVTGAAGYNLYKSSDSCTDALTRTDVYDTSASPNFQDGSAALDEGAFYAVEAFEAGTACGTVRVCLAGGCCSSAPAAPTNLLIGFGGTDVKMHWDDPAVPGMTWFRYEDTDPNPANWGAAKEWDITDGESLEAAIQHFTDMPLPAPNQVIYTKVTAIDCGESPLVQP